MCLRAESRTIPPNLRKSASLLFFFLSYLLMGTRRTIYHFILFYSVLFLKKKQQPFLTHCSPFGVNAKADARWDQLLLPAAGRYTAVPVTRCLLLLFQSIWGHIIDNLKRSNQGHDSGICQPLWPFHAWGRWQLCILWQRRKRWKGNWVFLLQGLIGRNTPAENDTGQINTAVFTGLFIRSKIMRLHLSSISATIFTSL